ncbi:unnamed protein product [Lampetra planeri]
MGHPPVSSPNLLPCISPAPSDIGRVPGAATTAGSGGGGGGWGRSCHGALTSATPAQETAPRERPGAAASILAAVPQGPRARRRTTEIERRGRHAPAREWATALVRARPHARSWPGNLPERHSIRAMDPHHPLHRGVIPILGVEVPEAKS